MTAEEPGLLGNLPRSRPGTRSAKRAAGGRIAGPEGPRAATRRDARRRGEADSAAEPDPVSEALRTAGRVAEAGLRAANGVTREVLRRLPRM